MAGFLRAQLVPLLLLTAGGLVATGCGGDGGNNGPPAPTTTIAKGDNSGDAQTGTVGQVLASPLQVVVTDGDAPSVGTSVTWSTTGGGTLDPTSAATNADGVASTTWTLGTTSGSQTAQASLSGASGSPVTFTATVAPDAASALSKFGGDQQNGIVSTPLAQPVQAKVADQFGNGIEGVTVNWAASGATVSAVSVPTNSSGISAVTVTRGAAEGDVTITASSGELAGSPVTFTATAAAAPPIPTTATVRVGNIFFTSDLNGTSNPAVDTVAVGGTVTWNWVGGSHSVQSTGTPSFTSSGIQPSGTYEFTFTTAGTYSYDCAVHGPAMSGQVVVR